MTVRIFNRNTVDNSIYDKHRCLMYYSQEERKDAILPFIADGLKGNTKCLYIYDSDTIPDIDLFLEQFGPNVLAAQKSGQLFFVRVQDAFLYENQFDPYQATLFLMEKAREALREGYQTLQFSCEMSGILPYAPHVDQLIQYEILLNRFVFANYDCRSICQYEAAKFNPHLLSEISAQHADLKNDRQNLQTRVL